MTYLLEVSACMIAFYGFYYFILRNKSFHRWNRFFLLGGLLLSLIIPALSIPVYETIVTVQNSPVSIGSAPFILDEVVLVENIDWFYFLKIFYIGISIFFLAGTIREVIKIYCAIRAGITNKEKSIVKVFMDNDLPTSSFFNYLFVPANAPINPMEYKHELAHIEQKHSLDKLFLSLLRAIFWFNPVIYFYKNSLDEIHEYLADQAVLDCSPTANYLEFLRDKIERQYQYALINPFYSLIKNRLTMINQNAKSSKKLFLMVAPLCFILIGVFSCDDYLTVKSPTVQSKIISDGESPNNELSYTADALPNLREILEAADYVLSDSNCKCNEFNLLYAPKGKDIQRVVNPGSKFNTDSKKLLSNAQTGDKYLLDNIKLDCENQILESGQIIISIVDKIREITVINSNVQDLEDPSKYLLYQDTITYFDEETYEETVRVIDVYGSEKEFKARKNAIYNDRRIFLYNDQNEMIYGGYYLYVPVREYLEKSQWVFEENEEIYYVIKENGITVEKSNLFSKVSNESKSEKKYLLYRDTITYFDEDTYEETVRVIDNYTTKEIYDAYQEAVKKDRRLVVYNKFGELQNQAFFLYEPLEDVLKKQFSWLNKDETYTYVITENGKEVESSNFKLADLK